MTDTAQPNERFLRDLRWFMDRVEVPDLVGDRIHTRDVWHDQTGGSKLGSKMLSADFRLWLEAGERATRIEVEDVPCSHPGRVEGNLCPVCILFDADGQPIGERGTVRREREFYRWPMRAAMARIARDSVARGCPNKATTLATIARANGDLVAAAEVLTRRFPVMGDPATALHHFADCLTSVKRVFAERPPVVVRQDRSDAQLDAESAA